MWQEVRYESLAMNRKRFTTVEAAAAAGIPRATLQYWIKTGKIAAPVVRLVGGKATRLWTEAQIGRIRRLKGTMKPGTKRPWQNAGWHQTKTGKVLPGRDR
jgi:hypothetical protein